jgi:uncharacterized membrane protein YgdD (TMEM256/DUF423 family)
MIGLYVTLAGVSGGLMVAAAALGAHGASLPEPALFDAAWRMHAVHSIAMLAIGMCRRPNPWLHGAFWPIMGGTVLFSGSLYGQGVGWWQGGTVLTPVGGLMLIAGWLALAIAGLYRLRYNGGASPKPDG